MHTCITYWYEYFNNMYPNKELFTTGHFKYPAKKFEREEEKRGNSCNLISKTSGREIFSRRNFCDCETFPPEIHLRP